jgi:signal transduction histidine kinase
VASIQVIQGPDKGRSFDLSKGENVIGRQSDVAPLTDGTVSRQHAKVVLRDTNYVLEDNGSANGTFLNGVKLTKPTALKRGDQIRCGASLLVFGGGRPSSQAALDVDEDGNLVDAAIVATVPSNEDSVIIPTPEAGAEAIGNLRLLYGMITDANSTFSVDILLQRTLDKVFDLLKRADRGYIMLIDKGGKLSLKASLLSDSAKDNNHGTQIPISRTIINEVVSKQVGVLSSNAMSDKRFTSGKSVHDFGIRSAICVPIKGREGVLGVIHVDTSVSNQTYSTEQLRLLTAIGYQTGMLLDNIRLHEETVRSERLAATGETVAYLSHHIKNMLQALIAGTDIVEMGLKKDDLAKAKQGWPIVQRNLGRINDLILNMLAFSKSREPLLETLNINHVLEDCLELVAAGADGRGVAVITDLDDQPPIPADAVGLHQAFMNLLNNALDAVPDQTGVVTVTSTYDSMNRQVVVSVADNGMGIDPGSLDKIFNAFYSTKGQKGTGLGLAVAQKVVKEHSGKISVQSAPREGTKFTIFLPSLAAKGSSDTTGAGN